MAISSKSETGSFDIKSASLEDARKFTIVCPEYDSVSDYELQSPPCIYPRTEDYSLVSSSTEECDVADNELVSFDTDSYDIDDYEIRAISCVNSNALLGPHSFILRCDPSKISEKEIREGFTERDINDPFNEIDPATLHSLRLERGLTVVMNNQRITLKDNKPSLSCKKVGHLTSVLDLTGFAFKAEEDKDYEAERQAIKAAVLLASPDAGWKLDLDPSFERRHTICIGCLQISNLRDEPTLVSNYKGDKKIYSFTADMLTYAPDRTALAGKQLFFATDDLLYNLLPFLKPLNGEERTKVICSFQSYPTKANDVLIPEAYLLTELH